MTQANADSFRRKSNPLDPTSAKKIEAIIQKYGNQQEEEVKPVFRKPVERKVHTERLQKFYGILSRQINSGYYKVRQVHYTPSDVSLEEKTTKVDEQVVIPQVEPLGLPEDAVDTKGSRSSSPDHDELEKIKRKRASSERKHWSVVLEETKKVLKPSRTNYAAPRSSREDDELLKQILAEIQEKEPEKITADSKGSLQQKVDAASGVEELETIDKETTPIKDDIDAALKRKIIQEYWADRAGTEDTEHSTGVIQGSIRLLTGGMKDTKEESQESIFLAAKPGFILGNTVRDVKPKITFMRESSRNFPDNIEEKLKSKEVDTSEVRRLQKLQSMNETVLPPFENIVYEEPISTKEVSVGSGIIEVPDQQDINVGTHSNYSIMSEEVSQPQMDIFAGTEELTEPLQPEPSAPPLKPSKEEPPKSATLTSHDIAHAKFAKRPPVSYIKINKRKQLLLSRKRQDSDDSSDVLSEQSNKLQNEAGDLKKNKMKGTTVYDIRVVGLAVEKPPKHRAKLSNQDSPAGVHGKKAKLKPPWAGTGVVYTRRHVPVRVQNTGLGIPAKTIEKLAQLKKLQGNYVNAHTQTPYEVLEVGPKFDPYYSFRGPEDVAIGDDSPLDYYAPPTKQNSPDNPPITRFGHNVPDGHRANNPMIGVDQRNIKSGPYKNIVTRKVRRRRQKALPKYEPPPPPPARKLRSKYYSPEDSLASFHKSSEYKYTTLEDVIEKLAESNSKVGALLFDLI